MQKRVFIQLIVVLTTGVLLASLYFLSICHHLRNANSGIPAKLNHIFYDSRRYDVLFVGSSRVLRNIDPLLFDSLTGMQSYNAGIDGANLTLIDLVVRKFFKSHGAPKFISINLDTYTMEYDTSFFYFSQFLPYMNDPDLQPMAKREPVLSYGNHYPFIAVSYFNDYLKEVSFKTAFNLGPFPDSLSLHRGFSPVSDTAYYGPSDELPLNFVCVPDRVKKLDSLCAFCRAKNCVVIFIMAPIYRAVERSAGNADTFYRTIGSLEERYSIRRINLLKDKNFPKNFFLNQTHLNSQGARLYTSIVSDTFNLYYRDPGRN